MRVGLVVEFRKRKKNVVRLVSLFYSNLPSLCCLSFCVLKSKQGGGQLVVRERVKERERGKYSLCTGSGEEGKAWGKVEGKVKVYCFCCIPVFPLLKGE